jgi:hypothetical protein
VCERREREREIKGREGEEGRKGTKDFKHMDSILILSLQGLPAIL